MCEWLLEAVLTGPPVVLGPGACALHPDVWLRANQLAQAQITL
ncbi:MAG TPA: hypothetical protein VGF67_34020 [Ktedonobacteraceae bacterium]